MFWFGYSIWPIQVIPTSLFKKDTSFVFKRETSTLSHFKMSDSFYCFTIIIILVDTTLNSGCGLWNRAGQKCYMFYDNPKSTWSQARDKCSSIGANLLNIKDVDTRVGLRTISVYYFYQIELVLVYFKRYSFVVHCFIDFLQLTRYRNIYLFILIRIKLISFEEDF